MMLLKSEGFEGDKSGGRGRFYRWKLRRRGGLWLRVIKRNKARGLIMIWERDDAVRKQAKMMKKESATRCELQYWIRWEVSYSFGEEVTRLRGEKESEGKVMVSDLDGGPILV